MPDQKARGEAVARLVEQLKRHPIEPKAAADRAAIYLMDLANGEVTLIADQPAPGITQCGSPTWSNDGRRILYDATPGTQFTVTRLKSIELRDGRLTVTDLGFRLLLYEALYESSVAEAFGNLPSSPAYLSPAFLKAEPSSMNFRC